MCVYILAKSKSTTLPTLGTPAGPLAYQLALKEKGDSGILFTPPPKKKNTLISALGVQAHSLKWNRQRHSHTSRLKENPCWKLYAYEFK